MSLTSINTFQGNSIAADHPSNRMDCSGDGQHIILYAGKRDNRFSQQLLTSAPSQIWISNDGGTTFTNRETFGGILHYETTDLTQLWYGNVRWLVSSVKCSSTGQYMIFNINDALYNYRAFFLASSDYGVTFTYLFDTSDGSTNNQVMEDFSISEPIEGGNVSFPCYVTFEHKGQIYVWSPLTSSTTTSLSGIKLNDISMSDDGSKIVFAGRNQVCKFSTDYGVNWTDVPTLTKGACCSLVDNQMIVVDYDSGTKSIEYSTDAGSTWSSSQIVLTENFHEASIGSNKIVLSGEGGKLFSSDDGSTWTEETTNLTDTLNGLTSFDAGFYFLNSSISGLRTFYSLSFDGTTSGATTSSTPIIVYNTSPLLKRVTSTIENESAVSFTVSLDHSKANSYLIQMLDEDNMISQPFFTATIYIKNTDNMIIPFSSQKVTSTSYESNIITFTLDSTYSGTFVFSYQLMN